MRTRRSCGDRSSEATARADRRRRAEDPPRTLHLAPVHYRPIASRCARTSGKPGGDDLGLRGRRRRRGHALTVIVRSSVSRMPKAARGSPSRGWPTAPQLTRYFAASSSGRLKRLAARRSDWMKVRVELEHRGNVCVPEQAERSLRHDRAPAARRGRRRCRRPRRTAIRGRSATQRIDSDGPGRQRRQPGAVAPASAWTPST